MRVILSTEKGSTGRKEAGTRGQTKQQHHEEGGGTQLLSDSVESKGKQGGDHDPSSQQRAPGDYIIHLL